MVKAQNFGLTGGFKKNLSQNFQVILEYLTIWGVVDDMVLDPAIPDQHSWHLSKSDSYRSKSIRPSLVLSGLLLGSEPGRVGLP
jgi:hypothetical protein